MNDKEIYVGPSDFCLDGEFLWLFHIRLNLLCRYNLNTEEVDACVSIPYESIYEERIINNLFSDEKNIYLIPGKAKDIYVFNKASLQFQNIPIPDDINIRQWQLKFSGAVEDGDDIYCIPCYYKGIIKFNKKSFEVTYLIDVNEYLNKNGYGNETDKAYINSCAILNNTIVCVIGKSNSLLTYNIKNGERKIVNIGKDDDILSEIRNTGKEILISVWNKRKIYICNNDLEIIKETSTLPYKSFSIYDFGESIFVDNQENGEISIIGKNNEILYQENKPENRNNTLDYPYHHGILKNTSIGILYYNRHSNELYIRKNGFEYETKELKVSGDKVFSSIKCVNEIMLQENDFINLDFLLC